MRVSVRLAARGDVESVLSLYYGFYRELRGRQGWPLGGVEEYRRDVERFLERDRVFLAFLEGRAAGFARLSEREGAYWLEELYVAPRYRGLGIGRRLVEEAEEYVRGRAPALYVMVLPQDGAAIRFWIHMGYRILNTVELVKDLEEPEGEETRLLEFFGYPLRIWRWRREEYDDVEREYLEALDEFYRLGGTRELYLKLAVEALRRWIEERSKLRRG